MKSKAVEGGLPMRVKISCLFLFIFMIIGYIIFPENVYAAGEHTVTYERLDGVQISQEVVPDGSAISLPSEPDVFMWLYDDCRKVEESFVPEKDMVIKCIYNSDVSEHGTLDGGKIVWCIANKTLYVTGKGTISIADKYNTGTKKYGFSIGTFKAENPSVMYEWLKEPAIGDEKAEGYGAVSIPEGKRTVEINVSRPIAFSGETIGVPATALLEAAPWCNYAGEIETVYIADDITLAGNFTAYFNLNSSQITPTAIQESRFRNLKTVYLYADTSAVTRTSGMFARCSSLTNVLVRSGQAFHSESITETANMFFGDSKLLCDSSDSIINTWSDFGSVTDARYMFMGCEALNKPMISVWDTTALRDATGMFAGCNKLGLTCSSSSDSAYDISGWDLSNVYSTAFMFAGTKIDMDNPTGGFWGAGGEGYDVIGGTVDMDALNLGAVQCAVYMFAQNRSLTGIKMTNALPVMEDISAMFAFCPQLKKVDMTGIQVPRLAYAVATFYESGAENAEADLSGADLSALEDGRYMFYKTGFSKINLDRTNPSALTDAQGMFARASALKDLGNEALSGWSLPQLKDGSYMFEADKALSVIDVSGWGMDSIGNISYMFADCPSITALNVSEWKIQSLEWMDAAFMNTGISRLAVSDWGTQNLKSAFRAFAGCISLEEIMIKDWDCSNLENVNGLFYGDTQLRMVDMSGWTGGKIYDAGGMCCNCSKLESINVSNLIRSAAENVSYMISGCENMHTADLSGWDTSNIKYAQGLFDGAALLEKISLSSKGGFANAISTGIMFRGCQSLNTSALQSIVNHMNLSSDKDMYEMFKGCEKVSTIDLSGVSFANAEDLTRFFYQEGSVLDTITVPGNFGISAKNFENLFHVGDDTVTTFKAVSSSIPALLKSYNWAGDNRVFIMFKDAVIDGKSRSDYIFTAASPENVKVEFIAESTFSLRDTPLPLTYQWKKDGKSLEDAVSSVDVTRDGAGRYSVTALIADLDHGGSLSHEYLLSSVDHVSSMTAEYKGAPIPVGHDYDKKDVKVTLYFNEQKDNSIVLAADSFNVDSVRVKKVGENTYTATYIDADNKTFQDEFTVPGIRVIGEIEAKYEGPVIHVGNDYDTANVTVTAYYEDDKAHKEGFEVVPSGFSSTKVTANKKNTFIATYEDKAQNKTFTAPFDVMGYIPVSSISAEYHGPDIEVGSDYKKDDVTVTIHFSDGTKDQVTTDFTLDSMRVSQVGENSYIVTYTDGYETKYTATIIVKGIEKEDKKEDDDSSTQAQGGNDSGQGSNGGASGTSAISAATDVQARTTAAGTVKTGDEQNLIGWIAFAVVITVLVVIALIYRKKTKE